MTIVYMLWHVYQSESGEDEEKLIGVYSDEKQARQAIERVKDKPGFRDHPDGFEIAETTLDRDSWIEGFGFEIADDE